MHCKYYLSCLVINFIHQIVFRLFNLKHHRYITNPHTNNIFPYECRAYRPALIY
jgi:hypothetical protein